MALLTVQEPTLAGITPTYAAADVAGDTFAYSGGNVVIHIKNTNAAQRVATILTPGTVEGVAIADPTVTIPATTGDKMIKLNAPGNLFVAATGLISITYDAVTNVTIGVFKV